MNVTATQVFPVETDLPDQWLSLLGCGITTGLGSVFNIAQVAPGSSVAIVGCGHLGLWMVQAARLAQARTIIALDPVGYRRELAGTLGATHTVDPSAEDPVTAVQALTGGRGADYVLEVISAQNGRVRMRHDLPRFVRMMEDGLVTPEPIITNEYTLDQINDALHASIDKRDLSGVIVPN